MSLPQQTRRKSPGAKTESDTEKSTKSTKTRDIDALKQLLKLQEDEKGVQAKERGRRKRKDSDEEKLAEISADAAPTGGSRRGRKRQVIRRIFGTEINHHVARVPLCYVFMFLSSIGQSRSFNWLAACVTKLRRQHDSFAVKKTQTWRQWWRDGCKSSW